MLNLWSRSVVALNLRVVSTTTPFSRISRPTRQCPTSAPTSFNSSVILNLPFSAFSGALLFHLPSKLNVRTSVVITTNLSFSEWATVFGDAKMATSLLGPDGKFGARDKSDQTK